MNKETIITNVYQINEIVEIKNYSDDYRIVDICLDTFNDKCKIIWYRLYRISDGYTCMVKENGLIRKEN